MSKSRKSCANRTLRVRKINFLVEILKQPQILIFSVLTAKNSLRKFFGRLVKSALLLTKVTFWGKLFLWSFVFFLRNWKKIFMPYGKRSLRSCKNWALWANCFKHFCGEKQEALFFLFLWYWMNILMPYGISLRICQNFFLRVQKNVYLVIKT